MDWKSAFQMLIPLLGGGAAGAVLKMLYDARQNRVPLIHYGKRARERSERDKILLEKLIKDEASQDLKRQ
jgi:hypothetical protein